MIEIRCKGCGRLLGEYAGKGKIKCPKTDCGGMNVFDTETVKHQFTPKHKSVPMKNRKTSSGITFG